MSESPDWEDTTGDPWRAPELEASADNGAEGFFTWVCVQCGNEYYSGGEDAPAPNKCTRCSSTVFRGYFTHEAEDDAATDFEDSTHRDLHTDDPEGDAMPGDVLDLNPD